MYICKVSKFALRCRNTLGRILQYISNSLYSSCQYSDSFLFFIQSNLGRNRKRLHMQAPQASTPSKTTANRKQLKWSLPKYQRLQRASVSWSPMVAETICGLDKYNTCTYSVLSPISKDSRVRNLSEAMELKSVSGQDNYISVYILTPWYPYMVQIAIQLLEASVPHTTGDWSPLLRL